MKVLIKLICYLLASIMALTVLWFVVMYFLFGRDIRDASYMNSYGDKAIIFHPSFWEVSVGYVYSAYNNKTLVVSPIYIHDTENFEKFEFIEVPDSRIVAVVQKSRLNALLVMQDFEKNQVWVCGHDNRTAEVEILSKLKACYPDKNYHSADRPLKRIPTVDSQKAINIIEKQWKISFPDSIKDMKAAYFSKKNHSMPNYVIKLTLNKNDYEPFLSSLGQIIDITDFTASEFGDFRERRYTPDWFLEPMNTGEIVCIQANNQSQKVYEKYCQKIFGKALGDRHRFTFYSDTSKEDEITLYMKFLITEQENLE